MESHRARLWIFWFFIVAVLGLILYRLFSLQILQGEKYLAFSQANTLREIPIQAPRGRILDRHGKILAENRPSFVLSVHPAHVRDWTKAFKTLSFLLNEDLETIQERLTKKKNPLLLAPIEVAADLTRDQMAAIRVKMSDLKLNAYPEMDATGIELMVSYERVYPFAEKVGHVLGYVREVGEKEFHEWAKKEPGRVTTGDKVGMIGVEKTFDDRLRGYDGFKQVMVDAGGKEINVKDKEFQELLQSKPAQAGENLQLTLDAHLMDIAYRAFGTKLGSLVALDPKTGEVLAMVSVPSFNPQNLTGTITGEMWEKLRDDPNKILLNRSIQAAYPPGSTYKIVSALAALGEGKTNPKEFITCPGYYAFGGRNWGCWNKRGHGRVDLFHALIESCDVYFYKMGERLGPNRLAKYAKLLGLGEKTGVLSDAERSGLIPTEEWKLKTRKEKWAPSDSLGIGIGQGDDLVTPFQNALMIAQVANGGKKISPHLILATEDQDGHRLPEAFPQPQPLDWPLTKKEIDLVKQALAGVVNNPGGTGAAARLPGITVAGKTGTAQVVALEVKGKKGVNTGDHAWFVAFAPAEDPQIALSVLVEHGGHGGAAAAPIAKQVMEAFFAEKQELNLEAPKIEAQNSKP